MKTTIEKLKEIRESLKKDWYCQAGREYDKVERKRLTKIIDSLIEELKKQ